MNAFITARLHGVLEVCLLAPDTELNHRLGELALGTMPLTHARILTRVVLTMNRHIYRTDSLAKLLEWVPLNDTVLSPALLDIWLRFLRLPNNTNSMRACLCINEVLRRNYVPQTTAAGSFLSRVLNELTSLLQAISAPEAIASLEHEYLAKFTEVINVFVCSQLMRLESAGIPSDAFLAQLFQFTVAQPSIEGLIPILEVWDEFLELLVSHKQQQDEAGARASAATDATLARFASGIVSLLERLFSIMLFSSNYDQLTELLAEEAEIEALWSKCLSIIDKSAQLYPDLCLPPIVRLLPLAACLAIATDTEHHRHSAKRLAIRLSSFFLSCRWFRLATYERLRQSPTIPRPYFVSSQ